ncbi:hypothetical protein [Halioxenophilus sp. WMMB6]|uniref:hypothetical protein n=1 Tax=Halioxenophilus sp. WMMB6 TaxID=3073815 RepID=UPI00295E6981|nr:hypothetical protein [Halioxenophilus sp. WMMB6]
MTQPNSDSKATAAPWAQAENLQPEVKPWWLDPKVMLPLGALLLLLAVVVFWLPRQINPAVVQPITTTAENPASSKPSPTAAESPWTEAQLSKQRRETQDILAELLDKQRRLEKSNVKQWAEQPFAEAMATANSGDEYYRQQQFEQAKQQYLATDQQFDALLSQSQQVLKENLALGLQALADLDPTTSQTALELVLAIDPSHSQAQSALARAQVLAQVLQLAKESDQAIQLNQLDQAAAKLKQAKALDPSSTFLAEKQAELNQRLAQRNFAEQMSAGYSALQANQFEQAIHSFKQALAIKPGAADASSALTQAQNGQSLSQIALHVRRAENHMAAEQWQQAVAEYDLALAVDESVVDTKIARLKANVRLQLDQTIQTLLAQPLRLADSQVYAKAGQTLADARSIANPGPRLQSQINSLAAAMKAAQTPVQVQLQSDNETQVTLYRVAALGAFQEHALDLKPGQYVLVGSRPGYRDVRKEFTIDGSQNPLVIQIQCDEKIASL